MKEEYSLTSATVPDWRQYVREILVDYIELNSEKLGGPNKIVELDESIFGKQKYHRGHPVEGQWVFGGVERDTGKLFMVAVPDRTAETLKTAIKQWILPGTTLYTDCWKGYKDLDKEGFTHWIVNHSLHFLVLDTVVHTNNIESMWRHAKVFLPSYNRQSYFKFYLAEYLFRKSCLMRGVHLFTQILKKAKEEKTLIKLSAEPNLEIVF